jgi:mRNA interferase RelE/StbE
MRVIITKQFEKEENRINNRQVSHQIADTIIQVQTAESIEQILSLKRLKGAKAHRIRIGDYRIGVLIENDTVEFISIGHRKAFYRTFP